VEGRSVDQSWKMGTKEEDANARSRTDCLDDLWSGKRGYTSGVFRSVYPCSAALEKYGREALSWEKLCLLIGSAEG